MRQCIDHLSKGIEVLVSNVDGNLVPVSTDASSLKQHFKAVIIGSGYGGAVAAQRLAKKFGNGVCVLERGSERIAGTFPANFSDLTADVRLSLLPEEITAGADDALWDIRLDKEMGTLVASGLGGGSLINAGIVLAPEKKVFETGWPKEISWDKLQHYFDRAEKKLSAMPIPNEVKKRLPKAVLFDELKNAAFQGEDTPIKPKFTINFSEQSKNKCIHCGDCMTGCNQNAKVSLDKTYLRDAKESGAQLFTGATVLWIEASSSEEAKWRVALEFTDSKLRENNPGPFFIETEQVVLAAGTLGSTEILFRSQKKGLSLSSMLGAKFSTNGDNISALYNLNVKSTKPLSYSDDLSLPQARQVGPSIVGMTRVNTQGTSVLIQETTLPSALGPLFEEAMTTAAVLHKCLVTDTKSAATHDPAAHDIQQLHSTLLMASMGNDDSANNMSFQTLDCNESSKPKESLRLNKASGTTEPGSPAVSHKAFEKLFQGIKFDGRFANKQTFLLKNPLIQPVPDALVNLFKGLAREEVTRSDYLYTHHPLGGCSMGDSVEVAVVNDQGQLYKPEGGVHKGIYVLDGSIIPVSLGTNPLLTICAISERACDEMIELSDSDGNVDLVNMPNDFPAQPINLPTLVETEFKFEEVLTGTGKLNGKQVNARLSMNIAPIKTRDLLYQPQATITISEAHLELTDTNGKMLGQASYTGSLTVPSLRIESLYKRIARAAVALYRRPLPDSGAPLGAAQANALLSHIGRRRDITYSLSKKPTETNQFGLPEALHGKKVLEFGIDSTAMQQWIEVNLESSPKSVLKLKLRADLLNMLGRFSSSFQLTQQSSMPKSILDLSRVLAYGVRATLHQHALGFVPPPAPANPPIADQSTGKFKRRLPHDRILGSGDRPYFAHQYPLEVAEENGVKANILLTRYGSKSQIKGSSHFIDGLTFNEASKAILLVHGFAASGTLFAHDGIELSLAGHLMDQDFDVWVLDYRTSIGLPIANTRSSIDDCARYDLPQAVNRILQERRSLVTRTEQDKLIVMAHCIGASVFSQAVLGGHLDSNLIDRAVLLQVAPIIRLTPTQHLRVRGTSFIRRFVKTEVLDLAIPSDQSLMDFVVDAIAGSYPHLDEASPKDDKAQYILAGQKYPRFSRLAARISFMMSPLFRPNNLGAGVLNHLDDFLGQGNVRQYFQLMYYAFRQRITDQDGKNAYLTPARVKTNWTFPTQIVMGQENRVFDLQTATLSWIYLLNNTDKQRLADHDLPSPLVIEGYGHLDCLLGKNAKNDVFSKLTPFVTNSHLGTMQVQALEPKKYLPRPPVMGPYLGWLRKEGNNIKARIWVSLEPTHDLNDGLGIVIKNASGTLRTIRITAFAAESGADAPDLCVAFDLDLQQEDMNGNSDITLIVTSLYYGYPIDVANLPSLPQKFLTTKQEGEEEVRVSDALNSIEEQRAKGYPIEVDQNEPGLGERVKFWDLPIIDSLVISAQTLRAVVDSNPNEVTFALGSCRYMPHLADRDLADQTFKRLSQSGRGEVKWDDRQATIPTAVLLVGDQVYIDSTMGLFEPPYKTERIYEPYREAWSSGDRHKAISGLPTYFMRDDHEFRNDFEPSSYGQQSQELYRGWAESAFREFQLLAMPDRDDPSKYWYSFEHGGFSFFVMDTRDRVGPSPVIDSASAQIISERQWDDLRQWLISTQSDRPRFIVSPSELAPWSIREGANLVYQLQSDGWLAFPSSLAKLAELDLSKVVFLCGNQHASSVASIQLGKNCSTPVITASPLYGPYPPVNPRATDVVKRGEYSTDLKVFFEGDNLALIQVKKNADPATWQLRVKFLRSTGDSVETTVDIL